MAHKKQPKPNISVRSYDDIMMKDPRENEEDEEREDNGEEDREEEEHGEQETETEDDVDEDCGRRQAAPYLALAMINQLVKDTPIKKMTRVQREMLDMHKNIDAEWEKEKASNMNLELDIRVRRDEESEERYYSRMQQWCERMVLAKESGIWDEEDNMMKNPHENRMKENADWTRERAAGVILTAFGERAEGTSGLCGNVGNLYQKKN